MFESTKHTFNKTVKQETGDDDQERAQALGDNNNPSLSLECFGDIRHTHTKKRKKERNPRSINR